MASEKKPEIVKLLSRINDGATSSQMTLSEVMRLCMRLGRLLKNKELSDWAKAEAGGYESTDSVPSYRIFNNGVRGTFLGPFGSSLSNVSIPQAVIEEKHQETLFKVYMDQPVGELEQIVSGNTETNSINIPWSGNAILYYQQKEIYQGYALNAAWQVMTTTILVGALEVIQARVLEFVLAIEEEMGIDVMDYEDTKTPETPSPERTGQIFHTTINGGSNFALGNNGTISQQSLQVQPGDLKGLKEKLSSLGVTDDLINDLDTALDKDQDEEADQTPGKHVQKWISKIMIMAGKGSLPLVSSMATTIIMAEVKRYLGLPPA